MKKGEKTVEISKKTLKRIFYGVAACIVLYWILHEPERFNNVFAVIKNVLSPFVLGATIAFILNVPMRSFEQLLGGIKQDKLRRLVAVLLTFLVIALVLALVFYLLIPQVTLTAESVAAKLPAFIERVYFDITEFLNDNPELLEWVNENTDFEKMDIAGLIERVLDMAGDSVSTIVSGMFSAIGGVANFLVNAVIAVVFAIYCLFQKEVLARQGRRLLYAFLPEKWSDYIVRVFRLSNSTFSNFFSGQCVEVCILGAMFAVSMAIFRMPYIPLVSVLVAVTAFIPVVGAFVGCGIGALLILVDNPIQALLFVAMFLVLQQIEGNMIYPRVVGTSIGLPGMWVLLAIAVGGELMGVLGMFLMIPMASVLYTLLREFAHVRLEKRAIDESKLVPHPPELRSHFREKRRKTKEKIAQKRNKNKQQK